MAIQQFYKVEESVEFIKVDTLEELQNYDGPGVKALVGEDNVVYEKQPVSWVAKNDLPQVISELQPVEGLGNPLSKVLVKVDPPEPGTPGFYFSNGSIRHVEGAPLHNVFLLGFNMSPGGSNVDKNWVGIGESFEINFNPAGGNEGLTEKHDYFIRKDGSQVRLESYTIEGTDGRKIHYYKSVHEFELRNPKTENIYFRVAANPDGSWAKISLTGANAIFEMGPGALHMLTNGQLMLTNCGLRIPKLAAPKGTTRTLKIDENGDVFSA